MLPDGRRQQHDARELPGLRREGARRARRRSRPRCEPLPPHRAQAAAHDRAGRGLLPRRRRRRGGAATRRSSAAWAAVDARHAAGGAAGPRSRASATARMEVWRPLLAIAELDGEAWSARARRRRALAQRRTPTKTPRSDCCCSRTSARSSSERKVAADRDRRPDRRARATSRSRPGASGGSTRRPTSRTGPPRAGSRSCSGPTASARRRVRVGDETPRRAIGAKTSWTPGSGSLPPRWRLPNTCNTRNIRHR